MAHVQETREPRHALAGQAVVAIGDEAPDRRRCRALCVGETGADAEAQSVRAFDDQGTEHAAIFAPARGVRDHACLGIIVGLVLEQVFAAADAVARVAMMQHQAFSTGGDDGIEPRIEFGGIADPELRDRLQPGDVGRGEQLAHVQDPRSERTGVGGQVEHHEMHATPCRVVGFVRAHDAAGLVETAARDPQFAVHRHRWPAAGEPGRRTDQLAAAGAQLVSVPATAHAVELLADPVLGDVDAGFVTRSQHQARRNRFGRRQRRRQQAARQ